ncbi:lipid-binding SYLF domain-containing protein [Ruficoccus sp. ZRK36]|uniref:lipid-binding SYLF domain-containing protein n=1 Tax=Ruficoccus sp. ZRK36 TaxID=2866311 RepID=UPI001C73CF79|nr:lipid-binding SYLF domain-containing protein [Ruficoccus sp. ZRK36]QYY36080.1 lipid-binding SYLF domain-containing protein [Ruficoccus sp. ZRK36]
MKKILSSLSVLLLCFSASSTLRADESLADLNKLLTDARGWLTSYQIDDKKAIPPELFQQAKGIFFCKMVGGSFVIGAQGGEGFGMIRKDGEWSAPAFYSVGSGSFGAQIGGGETTILMFLMNDEGLEVLSSDDTNWGGTAKAVGGPSSASASDSWSSDTSAKQNNALGQADIFYYVTATGLEASAAFKGTQCSYDEEATDTYYGTAGMTRESVYHGDHKVSKQAAAFIELLDQQAEGE